MRINTNSLCSFCLCSNKALVTIVGKHTFQEAKNRNTKKQSQTHSSDYMYITYRTKYSLIAFAVICLLYCTIILTYPTVQNRWLTSCSLTSFLMFGWDKNLAYRGGKRRVPEHSMFLVTLIGGYIGSLLGMFLCAHKTRKPKFWLILLLSILMFHGVQIVQALMPSIELLIFMWKQLRASPRVNIGVNPKVK